MKSDIAAQKDLRVLQQLSKMTERSQKMTERSQKMTERSQKRIKRARKIAKRLLKKRKRNVLDQNLRKQNQNHLPVLPLLQVSNIYMANEFTRNTS